MHTLNYKLTPSSNMQGCVPKLESMFQYIFGVFAGVTIVFGLWQVMNSIIVHDNKCAAHTVTSYCALFVFPACHGNLTYSAVSAVAMH